MDLQKKRWIYALNGFAMLLLMGCSDVWSVFVVPLENTFGWIRSETSMAYTIKVICYSVGSILAGALSPKLGFSKLGKIAAVMIGLGFFGSSFATQLWQIYFTYGVLCGIGLGMGYNCVVSTAPVWFPEKSGTITGMLLVGFALSTAVFGPVVNGLIASTGIGFAFRTLAVICFVIVFAGAFLIRTPSEEETAFLPKAKTSVVKNVRDIATAQMIKTPMFWLYFVSSAFLASVGLTMINHASPIMTEELFMTNNAAALVISVIAVSNGCGRLLGGVSYDKIGLKKTLTILSVGMAAAAAALYAALLAKNAALFVAIDCCAMVLYGMNATSILTIARELFGSKYFSLNYSVLCANTVISASIPSVVGGIRAATGNYKMAFLMLLVMTAAVIFFTFSLLRIYSREMKEAVPEKIK